MSIEDQACDSRARVVIKCDERRCRHYVRIAKDRERPLAEVENGLEDDEGLLREYA